MNKENNILWVVWDSDQLIPYPIFAPNDFSIAEAVEFAERVYKRFFVTAQIVTFNS